MARPKSTIKKVQRVLRFSKEADSALLKIRDTMTAARGNDVSLGEAAGAAFVDCAKVVTK